jgi:hypothetical protein
MTDDLAHLDAVALVMAAMIAWSAPQWIGYNRSIQRTMAVLAAFRESCMRGIIVEHPNSSDRDRRARWRYVIHELKDDSTRTGRSIPFIEWHPRKNQPSEFIHECMDSLLRHDAVMPRHVEINVDEWFLDPRWDYAVDRR